LQVLSTDDGIYNVKNVDTGATKNVELTSMRKSCRFLENLPVCLMRVQLKTVSNIPDAAVPENNAAIQMLHKLCAQEEMLKLEMVDEGISTVDLLSSSGDQPSLVTRMLPLMFTPVQENAAPPKALLTPATSPVAMPEKRKKPAPVLLEAARDLPPLPLSPPESPLPVRREESTNGGSQKSFERFFFNAMPKNLVPVGNKVSIIVLNAGDLTQTGYITACFFKHGKEAEDFQNLLNLVTKQGACDHNVVPGYVPK